MYKEVVLIKEKVASLIKLDKDIFYDYSIDELSSFTADSLTVRLSAYVLRNKDKHCVEVKIPLNCWEHFKQDYFPVKLLKVYPVKYSIVTHEVRQIWKGIVPTKGRKVIYQVNTY